jgi:hypothetical protein
MSGTVDQQHHMYAPCTILNFSRIKHSQENDRNVKTKAFYLNVDKDIDKNKLHLPRNQYGHTTPPGDNSIKRGKPTTSKCIHQLLDKRKTKMRLQKN